MGIVDNSSGYTGYLCNLSVTTFLQVLSITGYTGYLCNLSVTTFLRVLSITVLVIPVTFVI